MAIDLDHDQLFRLISDAVNAGIHAYLREIRPQTDNICKSEARRYVQRRGFRPRCIDTWLEHGLITASRTKAARNAPVLFSLDELNKVMMTVRAKRA